MSRRRPPKPLTERQLEVLATIQAFAAKHGYPPTLRELGKALRIRSTNGVRDHLVYLSKKGAIDFQPYKYRTIRVLTPAGAR